MNLKIIVNFKLFTNQWVFHEIYNPGIYHGGTLRYLYYGTWNTENGFEIHVNDNLYTRRQNSTRGLVLRAGVVVSFLLITNNEINELN